MLDIVIPIQRESAQLDKAIDALEKYTDNYNLILLKDSTVNVSDARQKALDEVVKSRYVCFLDDDSEMMHKGWLDNMLSMLKEKKDAGAVFACEKWGEEDIYTMGGGGQVEYGPAACMLIDRERIPEDVRWDSTIGLNNGWLGGDFEEVDYCYQLRHKGLKLYRCGDASFHHTGGRTTLKKFRGTDRQKTVATMSILLNYKYVKAPEDKDWFDGLKYIKANVNDDNMLAGGSLRECYSQGVLSRCN
jgi:hypothetical protein